MNKKPNRIDPELEPYDLGRFNGPAGRASFIAPLINDETIEGTVVIDNVEDAVPDDLTAVITDADTVVLSRGLVDHDLTVLTGDLAERGFRVVLIELPDEQIPGVVAEAIIRQKKSK